MQKSCNDALSIFSRYESVDCFVTLTANPQWDKIKNNLKLGKTTTDRPDLIIHVFH